MSNFQLPAGFRPSAGPSSGGGGGGGGSGPSPEEQAAQREKAAAQEEMKRGMISAMLEPEARERCQYSLISLERTHASVPHFADPSANGSTGDGAPGQDGSTRANQGESHG